MKHETPRHHDADRETLSALFDGELHGDAARFAMRRLGHDEAWRDACGRWQLLGDVLRGKASAQAPVGFAARVEAALAAEHIDDARPAAGAAGRAPNARRWSRSRVGGAALAASVAFVALLVVRPGFDETVQTQPTGAVTVAPIPLDGSAPAVPAPGPSATPLASVPQLAPPSTEAGDPVPAQPGSELGLAAAAVAVAELPRRARDQGSTRSQSQRAGLRSNRREAQALVQVASATPADAGRTTGGLVALLPPTGQADDLHPFLPPADEIPSRPWPGASLTVDPAGAVTAGYRSGGPGAASRGPFYPFEPRLSEAQAEALLEALRVETPPRTREGPRR